MSMRKRTKERGSCSKGKCHSPHLFTRIPSYNPISILSLFSDSALQSIHGWEKQLLWNRSCILLRSSLESILLFDRRGVDSDFLSSRSLCLSMRTLWLYVFRVWHAVCLGSNGAIGMHEADPSEFIYESARKVHSVCG